MMPMEVAAVDGAAYGPEPAEAVGRLREAEAEVPGEPRKGAEVRGPKMREAGADRSGEEVVLRALLKKVCVSQGAAAVSCRLGGEVPSSMPKIAASELRNSPSFVDLR